MIIIIITVVVVVVVQHKQCYKGIVDYIVYMQYDLRVSRYKHKQIIGTHLYISHRFQLDDFKFQNTQL